MNSIVTYLARRKGSPPGLVCGRVASRRAVYKDELQANLEHCRQKCRVTFETLTDKKANQSCKFPWGEEVSFAELQLYNMRRVQEHAAQWSLHLGHKLGSAPDWVARAEHNAA